MGVGFGCKCPERSKPVHERDWVVTEYKWNSGAFVTAGGEHSDYSEIRCLQCAARGRTKAKYVEKLKHMDWSEAHRISTTNKTNQRRG
ncbi:hypothetical protein NTH44_003147 [Vibrio metoecus]